MSQSNTWHGLEREARATGNVRLLDAARARHAALVPYATTDAILAVLADRSLESLDEREAVVRALVLEAQSTRGSFWTAVLALAFRPMLCWFAHRSHDLPRDEAEQRVLAEFVGVTFGLRVGERTIARLFWIVRERVRADRRHTHAWQSTRAAFVEDEYAPESAAAVEELVDLARLTRQIAAVAPHDGERLASYAERLQASRRRTERVAIRDAVKHHRTRGLTELRAVLT